MKALQNSVAQYRLRTFGTLTLQGPGTDTVLGKHGHHRRRLALLAALAAAGESGRSRDQLLLLFWPDVTQERARHSLDQLLYALRGSLGDSLFASTNPVRLNPEVVSSDVAAFNVQLERGDLEAAVAQYSGRFLDGFYLSDAPEFERWVEAERSRLATSYSSALERLAHKAEAAHDLDAAVRWWRRLAEADPVSSKNATGLIRALMNAGEYPAALRYAEQYEALVAQELGTSVGPAIAALVAQMRADAKTEPSVARKPVILEARPDRPAASLYVERRPNERVSAAFDRRRRSLPYLVGALVLTVSMIAAAWLVATRDSSAPAAAGEHSIAVLPLANVSGAQQDAAFVDGLSEDLIAALAKIPNLRVIARTSAFAFKNSEIGVRRIADSLGVSNILEGSVQRVGSHLRVQARLVDATTGSTRWSETYDHELRDIFAVQSDIAGAVARALDLQLGGFYRANIKRGPTNNIAAYELYLRGNDPALMRSDSSARAGFEYFRQAIALDPGYAAAYAGLARMHIRLGVDATDESLSRRERLSLAEEAALKAVALDSSVADAHAVVGLVRRNQYDFAAAEKELKLAVALDPTNARFREWLLQLYVWTERPALALAEARRAMELDPLAPTATAEFARALLANDRCDEALGALEKLRSLRPPLLRAGNLAAQCYARKEMWAQAITELQRTATTAGPRNQALQAYMFARAGRNAEAQTILTALLDRSRRIDGGAFEVATVYAGLRQKDNAFRWLDRAFDNRELLLDDLQTVLDGLRPDPHVDRFLRRLLPQKR